MVPICRLAVFLLFFCCSAYINKLPAQGHEDRLSKIDVLHYAFNLRLTDETDVIRGSALVTVRLLQPVTEVEFDLVGAGGGRKGMQINGIWEDGLQSEFLLDGETLVIRTAQPVQAGSERTYRIDYYGEPGDGLIISRNRHGDRTFFGDNWPDRARHWLPCVDHPSDKATVEFIVLAPDHYQVVANGTQIEETNLEGGKKLTHWSETVPIPTKVMVIGVAPFAVQYVAAVEGIPVTSWIFPKDREAGFADYARAAEVLDWFIGNIGPYPYEKLANVQSKTRYGGMENAGNIFYNENTVGRNADNEALFAHEIAHQWFGNSASEADWHHVWLSEGFATYSTDLYMEARYGPQRLRERMQEERSTVLRFNGSKRSPVVDTSITDYKRLLSPIVYQKGAWVLHMLRRRVGDDHFREGLRRYYDQYKLGNALTGDFRKVMETQSGMDLEAFFQQWVFTPGHPELSVEWTYDEQKGEITLGVIQKQAGEPFQFPLEVAIHGEGQIKSVKLDIDKAEYRSSFPLEFRPERVETDPEVWLLFEEK